MDSNNNNNNNLPVSQTTSNTQQMAQPNDQSLQQSFQVIQQQAYPQQQSFQVIQQQALPQQQSFQILQGQAPPLQQQQALPLHQQQAFPDARSYPIAQLPDHHLLYGGRVHANYPLYELPSIKYVEDFSYGDDEPLKPQETTTTTTEEETTTSLTTEQVENAIKLSLRLKKKTLQSSSFTEQALPMLVSLSVDNIKTAKRTPLDLVCVIDNSGSMRGEKIALVRNTFQYLLQYLSDSDRLSIVIFDHEASRLFPLIRITEENKDKILQKVATITERGGTNIARGMKHAFEILKQRRERNPLSSVVLLSDGHDKGAQDRVAQELEKAGEDVKDTTIHTFGFGNDHDPQLMTDIAAHRSGNFYFIQKLDTVDEAFVDCLGGLLSCVGQNVSIKIKPEQSQVLNGVEFTQAFGEAAMWTKDGDMYITKIANLISGKQRDFVLEVKVPVNKKELQDNEKNIVIATAEADITGLDGQHIIKKADLSITLLNEVEEVKDEEEDDREVMKNFYRLKGALLLNEAITLAAQKNNDEAKKQLENFKEELSNSFLKEEQFIKNLIKDIDQAIVNVSPQVYAEFGKHFLMENARAQMHQMSNLQSANCYQNTLQRDLLNDVKSQKSSNK